MKYKKESIRSIGELMTTSGNRVLTPVFAGESFPMMIDVTDEEFKKVRGDIDAMKILALSKLNRADEVINEEQFESFLLTCEKVDKNVSDEYVNEQLGKGIYNLRLNNVEYWIDGKFYTITNEDKLILNIGNGKTKILSEW